MTELLPRGTRAARTLTLLFLHGSGTGRGVGRDCRVVTPCLALTPRDENPGSVPDPGRKLLPCLAPASSLQSPGAAGLSAGLPATLRFP